MFNLNKKKSRLNLYKPSNNNILKYKFEAIGVLLIAAFLILIISLISYNPTDKSWLYFTTSNNIKNWAGALGANLSALIFYLFGSAAYAFVFGFILFAYSSIKEKTFSFIRIATFLFLVISLSALFFSFNLDFTKSYPGGLVGYYFFNALSSILGILGSRIVFFAFVSVGIIIAGKISLFSIFKNSLKVLWATTKYGSLYFYKIINTISKKVIFSFIYFSKSIYKKIKNFIFKKKNEQLFAARNKGVTRESGNRVSQVLSQESAVLYGYVTKSVREKFKSKQFYKKSYKVAIDSINFLFLPNTIFNKNIFNPNFTDKFLKLFNEALKEQKNNVEKTSSFIAPKIEYKLPDTKILQNDEPIDEKLNKKLEEEGVLKAKRLEEKLSYFGVKGKVTAIRPGPVITLFEYKPKIDSKISKIIALEDDLALALMALSIRIVAPIPGRSVIGFEISNKSRQIVTLSSILNKKAFKTFKGRLPIVFGVDIVGRPVIQDLAGMPHLLVAGSTGSGKSVGMNAMLVSLLYNYSPENLKLILIDPKRLEFAPYKDIPHLLFPILTNPRNAAPVLKWLVQEMERRYDLMAEAGVRNISEYQEYCQKNKDMEKMPFIVLMIDELADLMMVAGKDIELHIARIAQMARAAGIHMVVATQRPSVDVVTGLIKVNFPSRVAFRVTSKIDSRTIVDGAGAEKLLGRGDMLYMNSASSDLQRIHGAYIGVKDIEKLTNYLRKQGKPQYLDLNETLREMTKQEVEIVEDKLYPEVVDFLNTINELSISSLQRKYRIGFNRSARLIERLELDGFIAPAQGSKPRKVLKENL